MCTLRLAVTTQDTQPLIRHVTAQAPFLPRYVLLLPSIFPLPVNYSFQPTSVALVTSHTLTYKSVQSHWPTLHSPPLISPFFVPLLFYNSDRLFIPQDGQLAAGQRGPDWGEASGAKTSWSREMLPSGCGIWRRSSSLKQSALLFPDQTAHKRERHHT